VPEQRGHPAGHGGSLSPGSSCGQWPL